MWRCRSSRVSGILGRIPRSSSSSSSSSRGYDYTFACLLHSYSWFSENTEKNLYHSTSVSVHFFPYFISSAIFSTSSSAFTCQQKEKWVWTWLCIPFFFSGSHHVIIYISTYIHHHICFLMCAKKKIYAPWKFSWKYWYLPNVRLFLKLERKKAL